MLRSYMVVGIVGLVACSSGKGSSTEAPPVEEEVGHPDPHPDTGGGAEAGGGGDGVVDTAGDTGAGVDTGGSGDTGGGEDPSGDVAYECVGFERVSANTFGKSQYYGADYEEGYGGFECRCTFALAGEPGNTPVGVTVYQSTASFQSSEWAGSTTDSSKRYAPAYVHVSLPGGGIGKSYNPLDESRVDNSATSSTWSAFTNDVDDPWNDSGAFGFVTPFADEAPFAGGYTMRLSLVNAGTTSSSTRTPEAERKANALFDCSAYEASPLYFRIDTTALDSKAAGTDPTFIPGATAFTELKLDNLFTARTYAIPIRGAAGIVGAEALSVQVLDWSSASWIELRDRSGRVHRLSPSRTSLELPPGTGAVETLEWSFGNDDPAVRITSGPTVRLRHRGQNIVRPSGGFRVSWRNLLAAVGRSVGGDFSVPGFDPLPDWTALSLHPDGLMPGQENPTLTLKAPLAGTLFTLPLSPGANNLYSWSVETPIATFAGRFQEQPGPRVGLWVDTARVVSPLGAMQLNPAHVIVEMDHGLQ